jgi:uncharacterized protein (DUF302 family)
MLTLINKMVCKMTTQKSFDAVCQALEANAPLRQFRVLAVHDVQKTLGEKGFERPPLRIIEVCNAAFAHESLAKEIDASIFMPCKFVVYTDQGKTVISLGRPSAIAEFLPGTGLEHVSGQIEESLVAVMRDSV